MPTDNSSRPCPWCKTPVTAATTKTESSKTFFGRWEFTEAAGHCSACGQHVLWTYDLRPADEEEVRQAIRDHYRALAIECGMGALLDPPEDAPKAP